MGKIKVPHVQTAHYLLLLLFFSNYLLDEQRCWCVICYVYCCKLPLVLLIDSFPNWPWLLAWVLIRKRDFKDMYCARWNMITSYRYNLVLPFFISVIWHCGWKIEGVRPERSNRDRREREEGPNHSDCAGVHEGVGHTWDLPIRQLVSNSDFMSCQGSVL